MSQYLLIGSSADGVIYDWYDSDDAVNAMLREAHNEVGISRFATWRELNGEQPEYWPEGTGMLLKVEQVVPEPVTSAWKLPTS